MTRILIAGGGIAGLGAALALSRHGRVTVFDRDPAPPEGAMNEVFDGWERKGATQFRHSHVFLARLFTLIRDRYPDLLDALHAAGARELKLRDQLPATLAPRYRPRRRDADLSIMSCRRSTLEAVMRRYASEAGGIEFTSNAKVRGIVLEQPGNAPPRASGLIVEHDGTTEQTPGDIVIDASGRATQFPDWLAQSGITVTAEEAPSGILYYTRHYALNPGQEEPARSSWFAPGAGDLGYIKYGVFPADDGHFSVTLSVPEIETQIRKRILDGEVFDFICASLPGVTRWTDPLRARPTSKVFAMGDLKSVWRNHVTNGVPTVLDFFAIGDAAIRTNPLYGRGCSIGFLQAHLLADVMRKTCDPVSRAKLFALRTEEEVRPFYRSMVRQDQAAIRLAGRMQAGAPAQFAPRFLRSFAEHGIVPAVRADESVLRAMLRSLHMLSGPEEWMLRPGIVARMALLWATPRPLKARFYPGKLGPEREELLDQIA